MSGERAIDLLTEMMDLTLPVSVPAPVKSSPAETPTILSGFPRFPEFPMEIRLQIFKETHPGPRLVQLTFNGRAFKRQGKKGFGSKAPVPPMFHICRESRGVGLKISKLAFGFLGAAGTVPNFEVDTIYFGAQSAKEVASLKALPD